MAIDEQIMPKKKFAFQNPEEKVRKPVQQPAKTARQEVQTEPEPQVQFNIPMAPQATLAQQPVQNIQQTRPAEKGAWKKWVVTLAIIILVVALGFYFLVL